MTMTEKARKTAQYVSLCRPDFEGDSVAVVVMQDPDLTAQEVIEILDEAAADFAAEQHAGND